jgi:hypothetical protein
MLLVRPSHPCDLQVGLGLGHSLLSLTSSTGRSAVAVEHFGGTGVVLGAHAHATRITVSNQRVRRVSSGAPMFVDGVVYVGLALPSVDTLFKDASYRTLLNRNVRPLLSALRRLRCAAVYLGRDWISAGPSSGRRALFGLGFEVTRPGTVLVEAIGSLRSELRVPREEATDLELALQRYGTRPTLPLTEVTSDPVAWIESLRLALCEEVGAGRPSQLEHVQPLPVSERDEGWTALGTTLEVPIGYLERTTKDGAVRVGGDLLTGGYCLEDLERGLELHEDAPIDGATWSDVKAILRQTRPV